MAKAKAKEVEIDISNINYLESFNHTLRTLMYNPTFGRLSSTMMKNMEKMQVYFNESDFIYRYNNAIVIGLNSPYVKRGTRDDAYHNICTKIAEQVGLYRLTAKIPTDSFLQKKNTEYSNRLNNYIKDLFLVLENIRTNKITEGVSQYVRYNIAHIAKLDMRYLAKKVKDDIKEIEKVGGMTPVLKLLVLRDMIRFMSASVMAGKGLILETSNEELDDLAKKIYPLMLFAPDANNTKTIITMTQKVLDLIHPLLLEAKQQLIEEEGKLASVFGFKDIGVRDPYEGKKSDKESEFTKLMNKLFGEEEMRQGHQVEEDIDLKQYEETNYYDVLEEEEVDVPHEVVNIGQTMDKEEEEEGFSISENSTYSTQYRPAVTASMAKAYFEGGKKSEYQFIKEEDEDRSIKNIFVEINSALHEGCQAFFKDRKRMKKLSVMELKELEEVMDPYANLIARAMQALVQQTINRSLDYEQMGVLNSSKLVDFKAFGDTDMFNPEEIEITQLIMEIMILVDNSGSQGAPVLNRKNNVSEPRYKFNQMYTLLLHMVCKKMKFPHSIWTFHESSKEKQSMSALVHRENCFDDDSGLYIGEIGAHGSNRDGFAIRYAGKYLNATSRTSNRLMFVISDGQPAGAGYNGHKAVQDVHDAVQEVQADGASVIGIFTGAEEENDLFTKMYDKTIFVNNENINDLPDHLKSHLIKEFRGKLNAPI